VLAFPEEQDFLSKLLQKARGGDNKAFEEIFHLYERRIYNLIYQMIGNADQAADLTQDVFLRVLKGLKDLRVDEAFNSWIYRVAVNMCRDHIRRVRPVRIDSLDQGRSQDDEDGGTIEIPDWSGNPENLVELDEMQGAVRRAVAALPEHYRSVVVLYHLQGKAVAEIASILGCRIGTVKSRLSRGRDELKRRLENYVAGNL